MSSEITKFCDCLSPDTELKILLFRQMGYKFAVEMSQVTNMVLPESLTDREVNIFYLHDKVSFKKDVTYQEPFALIVRDETDNAIIVDSPQEVFTTEVRFIHPMPLITLPPRHPIWGAIVKKEELIFLIDCYRFLEYEKN